MEGKAHQVTAIGALGLPVTEIGPILQEVAATLVQRGHPRDHVIRRLNDGLDHGWFNEQSWYDSTIGPVVDNLREILDLAPLEACGGCGEQVDDGHTLHPGCCLHVSADAAMDALDPARESRDLAICIDCGSTLIAATDDDGAYWEIA